MSDPGHEAHEDRLQHDLAQEQAVTDLDQAVGDREQGLADRDDAQLASRSADLDKGQVPETNDPGSETQLLRRRLELENARQRRDSHQDQLDHAQTGRDRHQDLLDYQQEGLDQHARETRLELNSNDAKTARARAAHERAEAAVRRAEAALRRAESLDERHAV